MSSSVSSYTGDFYCISARFARSDISTASAQMLTAVGQGTISPTATRKFVNFLGISSVADETELNKQFKCLAAGTWQNMACNIESSTTTGRTTVTNRVNGSNGSMAISVGASSSGYFEDTTHSDSVSVADLLDYGFLGTSTDTCSFSLQWIGAHFVASTSSQCMIGGSGDMPVGIIGTNYCSLFGGGNVATIDTARATGLFPYALTASNYTNYVTGLSGPPNPGAATFTLLRNGSASMLSISTQTGQTGYYTDTNHTVSFAVGDTCANQIAVTQGNVTWASAALLIAAT